MVYKLAIVGSTSDKFDERSAQTAKNLIRNIINECVDAHKDTIVISGASPKGGIDVWTEMVATEMTIKTEIYAPQVNRWYDIADKIGFKSRNLQIARACDEIHVIVPYMYPANYTGDQTACYHCQRHGIRDQHVKSAGCWTMWNANELGKSCYRHVIGNRAERAVNEVIKHV